MIDITYIIFACIALFAYIIGHAIGKRNTASKVYKDAEIKKSKLEADSDNIQKEINRLIDTKNQTIARLEVEHQESKDKYEKQIAEMKQEYDSLSNDVDEMETERVLDMIDNTRDLVNLEDSRIYAEEFKKLAQEEKELIKNARASVRGDKRRTALINLVVKLFCNDANLVIAKCTADNYNTVKDKLYKSYSDCNKLIEFEKITISKVFLQHKEAELKTKWLQKIAIEEEKEVIRKQKEEEKELRQAEAERQKELLKIQKDIEKTQREAEEKQRRLAQEARTEAEKEALRQQIAELEKQIADYNNKEVALEEHVVSKSGYVYIISQPDNDRLKIGMTRRLEPFDRIRELSNASVPFKMNVHAMIFSKDASTLETKLHEVFNDNRVNRINRRKEWFNVTLNEVEREVHKIDPTAIFDYEPMNYEYMETMKMLEV